MVALGSSRYLAIAPPQSCVLAITPQNRTPASNKREDQLWPRFAKGEVFDVAVYFHEQQHFPAHYHGDVNKLVWAEQGLPLAGTGIDLTKPIVYRPSPEVQNNGTLFMHAFFTRPGASPDPTSPDYRRAESFHKVRVGVFFWGRQDSDGRRGWLVPRRAGEGRVLQQRTLPPPRWLAELLPWPPAKTTSAMFCSPPDTRLYTRSPNESAGRLLAPRQTTTYHRPQTCCAHHKHAEVARNPPAHL